MYKRKDRRALGFRRVALSVHPVGWAFLWLPLVALSACSARPTVDVEREADWLGGPTLKGGKVAVLPVVSADGVGRADLEREVVGSVGAFVGGGGEVMEPAVVRRVVGPGMSNLTDALEAYRTRTEVDGAKLAEVGRALGVDYLVLVRLSQITGYVGPSRAGFARAGEGAGATVRLAVVRAGDGAVGFEGVVRVTREGPTFAREPVTSPVSSSQITRSVETERMQGVSPAATPGAVVREGVKVLLERMQSGKR